ncbi:hypothetical protein D3878_10225 [Noviherbaspirillum sedimenti]|uniref:Uncharacterized protein n=1 Tax=Noviherbaspirillum sedimenti TaxID=2320865 RepID=A0A3A3G0C3_9BURK|nr:hypothetical protein D3878_10225 [Noviherbaspirillum sedimenti]
MPLVVMLHGCAQTASQFAQSTRMNQLADKKGFAVLYRQKTASAIREAAARLVHLPVMPAKLMATISARKTCCRFARSANLAMPGAVAMNRLISAMAANAPTERARASLA